MIGLALIAIIQILALGIRGLLEDTIIRPLLYLIWGLIRIIQSLPQSAIWFTIVLALAIMALASLWGSRRRRPERGPRHIPHGRVFNWMRLIALAQQHEYSRWRFAQRMALMLAESIAERERIELRAARQRLADGEIDAPPHVAAFLRAGLDGYRQPTGFALWRKPQPALDVDLDQVVAAVERILNIQR